MTPQDQLIKHDPANGLWGDCQRTCIAVILDLPAADVPHFCDKLNLKGEPAAAAELRAWLADRALAFMSWPVHGSTRLETVLDQTMQSCPGAPVMLCGASRRGSDHVVVVMNGAIACDPSGSGIVGPSSDGYWWIQAITVGADWKGRTEP